MNQQQRLARKLIENDSERRGLLINEHARLVNAELAAFFQRICYEVRTLFTANISRKKNALGGNFNLQ